MSSRAGQILKKQDARAKRRNQIGTKIVNIRMPDIEDDIHICYCRLFDNFKGRGCISLIRNGQTDLTTVRGDEKGFRNFHISLDNGRVPDIPLRRLNRMLNTIG